MLLNNNTVDDEKEAATKMTKMTVPKDPKEKAALAAADNQSDDGTKLTIEQYQALGDDDDDDHHNNDRIMAANQFANTNDPKNKLLALLSDTIPELSKKLNQSQAMAILEAVDIKGIGSRTPSLLQWGNVKIE